MSVVYVLSKTGKPLMPCKPARARHLLRDGEAQVVSMLPFTIRLTVESTEETQSVIVGVDLGASRVGVAAVGGGKVLYQGEVALRTDIHWGMERRATYRRSRRGRKLRYRSPRFNNRAASKRKGRMPPSIESRADTVVKIVGRLAGFLPISHIVVEMANFDTQAMRAGRRLQNWEYQQGPQYGYENIKMFVRARDEYACQYCGAKNPPRLEVDHIMPRGRGGSTTPDNLVAACHDCNQAKGDQTAAEFGCPKVQQRVKTSLKPAAHTQQGKTYILEQLSSIAPVSTTYGYITKVDRQAMGLSKTHYYDAVAIAAGNRNVVPLGWYEKMRAVSRGRRQQRRGLHSQYVARLPYEVFGFRQWDTVRLPDGSVGFVKARRRSGSFRIADIDGNEIKGHITYKKLELIRRATTLLTEIRTNVPT